MHRDLIFVCHASTRATRLATFPADDPIDEAGRTRAVVAATSASGRGQAWCAPSLAARQTALACGLDATDEPAIRDCDFGRWAGRPVADVLRDEPDGFRAWMTDPGSAPHGGEPLNALVARVGRWLDERRQARGGGIAVTHPAVVRAAIIHALEATTATFWHLDIAPLSQTCLRTDGRRWTLRSLHE